MIDQAVLQELYEDVAGIPDPGQVARYIPELASVPAERFGVHLAMLDGTRYGVGDHEERFSIQSIVKVPAMALAFKHLGENLWERVGVEPSGSAFNSLAQLEYEQGIPRNPLINAGALVVCDMLCELFDDPLRAFIDFLSEISGLPHISINEAVARSEQEHGYRNAALVNMMKSCGNIRHDVDRVLDLYYHQCAVELSCSELTDVFLFFANHGKTLGSNREILTPSMTKRLNAVMLTCGFYDEAGEFTYKVGLPGKSGVGGGIAAIHPGHYAVAVWSPRLNAKGNSVKGMRLLEVLTTRTGFSIF